MLTLMSIGEKMNQSLYLSANRVPAKYFLISFDKDNLLYQQKR